MTSAGSSTPTGNTVPASTTPANPTPTGGSYSPASTSSYSPASTSSYKPASTSSYSPAPTSPASPASPTTPSGLPKSYAKQYPAYPSPSSGDCSDGSCEMSPVQEQSPPATENMEDCDCEGSPPWPSPGEPDCQSYRHDFMTCHVCYHIHHMQYNALLRCKASYLLLSSIAYGVLASARCHHDSHMGKDIAGISGLFCLSIDINQ